MTQDTRKDPRAKVLTMTVRYKSATLDEFIEHHSYDVSRGGMFIKTPSPFPPGTLLKFEVKISGEQRVMQGVGRVVWKRESSEVSEARPAGMGVKFIKIDDESRKVIDQLVAARGDAASAYEQGGEGATPTRPDASSRASDAGPGPKPQVVAPPMRAPDPNAILNKPRKATMIGLGAMQAEPESPETAAAEAFFPPSHPDIDMPAPEDRTVMKQAAELLQDALREAGGSLEEVGTTKEATLPKVEAKPESLKSEPSKAEPKAEPPKTEPARPRDGEKSERSVIVNSRPRDEVTQPAVRRTSVAPAAPRKSEPPRPRSAALQESAGAAADSGGGGRMLFALVAVAAAAGVVYFLTKPEPEAPPPPEPAPVAEPAPAPQPEAPAVVEPTPTATAQAPAPESSAAAATPSAAAPSPSVAPAAPSAPVAEKPLVPEAKPIVTAAPNPVVRPKPKPKPKPVEPPAGDAPAEPKPPAEATPPAAEPKPTASPEPAPPPAPKPAPAPKPTPAPKPADPGDNPY